MKTLYEMLTIAFLISVLSGIIYLSNIIHNSLPVEKSVAFWVGWSFAVIIVTALLPAIIYFIRYLVRKKLKA